MTPGSPPLCPQQVHALEEAFDLPQALRDLAHLCGAAFAGRRVGTEGHARAQTWLMERFQQERLEMTVYEVPLEVPVLDVYALPHLFLLGENGAVLDSLTYRTAFCEHPRTVHHPEAVQGVARPWQDSTEVHGAWVILDAVPQGQAFTALAEDLARQGAIGVLLPMHPGPEGYLTKRIGSRSPIELPVLSVRADLLANLPGKRLRAMIPVRALAAIGSHVLGHLPGTDPALAAAPLLVGAHYDGVGDDVAGFRFPCATDNAAAVALLLSIIRVLGDLPGHPCRPLIFAAFDAEELDALGSKAYAQFFIDQGMIPLVINLDGVAQFHEAVRVEASPHADALVAALDQAGRWLKIPLVMGPVSSDNRRFAAAGLPAVGIAAGAASIHTPADVSELVEHEVMRMVSALLLATIWQLAW
jgi:aminopeptidase YwaD